MRLWDARDKRFVEHIVRRAVYKKMWRNEDGTNTIVFELECGHKIKNPKEFRSRYICKECEAEARKGAANE